MRGILVSLGVLWLCTLTTSLACQPPHTCIQDVHLIGLTASTDGTPAVTVAGQHKSFVTDFQFTVRNLQVSPACSATDHSSRCQKLQMITSGQSYTVVVPLQGVVGIMQLQYDGTDLLRASDASLSLTSEFAIDDCPLLDIITFDGRLIALCLERSRVLRSCSINVNQTFTPHSTLSNCVRLHTLASSVEYRYISNFVPFGDQVVFAAQGVIYGIRFDRYDALQYSTLGDVTCNRLEYDGNQDHIFYAYCAMGRTIVYNIDTPLVESVITPGLFVPFLCPQSESTLFEVQQTSRGTVVRYDSRMYTTSGLNFTHGKCYNSDTFFLVDSTEGTKVFQIHQNSGSFRFFSNSSRDVNIVVFNGPYVVVHRSDPSAEVVLYNPTFQSIVELHGVVMATAIVINSRRQPTTMPSGMMSQTTPPTLPTDNPPRNDESLSAGVWAGIVVVIVIVLALFAIPVIVLAIMYKKSSRGDWRPDSHIIEENGLTDTDQESECQSTPEPHRSEEPSPKMELENIPRASGSQHSVSGSPGSGSQHGASGSLGFESPLLQSNSQTPEGGHRPPSPSTMNSFEETTTPHCASAGRPASRYALDGCHPPIPSTSITPEELGDKLDQRTKTDDQRNDLLRKEQYLRNNN